MDDLGILIKLLNAKLIVFFENGFTPENKFDKVLHDLLFLDNEDIKLLFDELIQKGYKNFVENLESFLIIFKKTLKEDGKNISDIPEDEIGIFLSVLKEEKPIYTNSLEMYANIKSEHDSISESGVEIFSIFNKYGISMIFPGEYEQIRDIIIGNEPWKPFRVFRDYNQTVRDEIKESIEKRVQNEYDFCICIVDNHFPDGYKAGQIVSFLNQDLDNKKVASIVFSSRDKGDWSKFPPHYYVEYVKKDGNTLEKIVRGLALCSYKLIFNNLKGFNEEALESAFNMALESKENMEYLACMACEEGTTAFEVLNKWFNLALKRSVSEKLNAREPSYEMIIQITNFLNKGFESNLDTDDSYSSQFEKELQLLNTYEIFDYYINLQHQPPAPGDVFVIDGDSNNFYVLVGQDCDFTVRPGNTCRNDVFADLLSASFSPYSISEKIDENKRGEMSFNYFIKDNDKFGVLDVRLGSRKVIDFNILDICTFNRDGKCAISLTEPLKDGINNMVSDLWNDLYRILQIKFKKISDSDKLLGEAGLDKVMSIYGVSEFQYHHTESEIIFPIRRICRIKGEFKDLLIKRYWDYRSRIGYNSINITKIHKMNLSYIEYKYPGTRDINEIRINSEFSIKRSNKRKKNKNLTEIPWCINFEDIINSLKGVGITIISKTKNIEMNQKNITESHSGVFLRKVEKDIDRKQAFGIEVTLPYTIKRQDGTYLKTLKEKIDILELTGINKNEFLSSNLSLMNLDKTSKIDVLDEGMNFRKLNIIDEVFNGILIPEKNMKITAKKETGEIFVEFPVTLEEVAAIKTS